MGARLLLASDGEPFGVKIKPTFSRSGHLSFAATYASWKERLLQQGVVTEAKTVMTRAPRESR